MAEFQLVVQFSLADGDRQLFDRILELEERLREKLDADRSLVDGHDVGSGEMNIFVLTTDPGETFAEIKAVLAERSILSQSRVAYRSTDADEYVPMWPDGLTTFEVK